MRKMGNIQTERGKGDIDTTRGASADQTIRAKGFEKWGGETQGQR